MEKVGVQNPDVFVHDSYVSVSNVAVALSLLAALVIAASLMYWSRRRR